MTVMEATIKVLGNGGYEMGEPVAIPDRVDVDDWADTLAADHGLENVTSMSTGAL